MRQPILNPKEIFIDYSVPEHLKGEENTKRLRELDLIKLYEELKENDSSLEEKINSGVIWRATFPGMILDVGLMTSHKNERIGIQGTPIHPHRADLAYKEDKTLDYNVAPLTVNALLRDVNEDFILGIRGGNVEGGKIGIVPGGHTEFLNPRVKNPIETFATEFQEELGYEFKGEMKLPAVGVFNNKDTKGVNILYTTKTNLSFPQVLERWKSAKDRGEHSSLFKATYDNINELAETGRLNLDGKNYQTTPFFQDCFKYFLQVQ